MADLCGWRRRLLVFPRAECGIGSWMRNRLAAILLLCCAGSLIAVSLAGARTPRWAPESRATIHPGVMTDTNGAQCTANFVFYDRNVVYIGQAAHCAGTGASDETDGCHAKSLALNTPVAIEGARRPGRIVYSSWLTMQRRRERDANACADNDFALVRISRVDFGRVNPTIPFWGGPTGIETRTTLGQTVLSYGNSELRGGNPVLARKQGKSLGDGDGGWTHTVYTATPGIPGDSGSAFIDDHGRAFGVLSTVALAPLAASNGVGDLSKELAYLRHRTRFRIALAHGTRRFRGPLP